MRAKVPRRCPGSTRKDSTSDARMTQMTTIGMVRRIEPMIPPISSNGIKAAMVVSEEDTTGASIRRAPPSAELSASSPRSKCVTASSPTTIASSTMMPSVMINPNRLIMFTEPP